MNKDKIVKFFNIKYKLKKKIRQTYDLLKDVFMVYVIIVTIIYKVNSFVLCPRS